MQDYKFHNKLSAKGKIWQIKPHNENNSLALKQKFQVSDIVSRILDMKGVNLDTASDFLDPKLKNLLPDPSSLLDMDKAVERIYKAITSNENIVIYGDYDVDGATSSAILRRFFNSINVENKTYIPDRLQEGYGLNTDALLKLKNEGANLVITVDCGVVSFEPISEAKKVGLETIVIDHHLSTEKMPEAVAVVNPNRFDENNNLTNLCAAGVVFLLVIALNRKLKQSNYYQDNNLPEPNILQYLDLVALGTVCDVMTLTGLNRAFVQQGLKIMAQRNNVGINALSEIAELDRKPDVYSLGFIIGPRINAGGRIGNCRLGSDLLSTDCPMTAKEIAEILHKLNAERKDIEAQTLEESEEQIAKIPEEDQFITISSDNWHPGVIGIAAGRIKDKYEKPTAVIAIDNKDGLGKASVRSVGKIDIGRAIANAKNQGLLLNGGGHKAAGGFTVEKDKIPELHKFLCDQVAEEYKLFKSSNSKQADLCLKTQHLNIDLINEIESLNPYGNGNPEPTVILDNVKCFKMKIYSDKHIAYLVQNDGISTSLGKAIKAISFNVIGTELGDALLAANGKNASIVGKLKKNEWNGNESVEFIINDIIL